MGLPQSFLVAPLQRRLAAAVTINHRLCGSPVLIKCFKVAGGFLGLAARIRGTILVPWENGPPEARRHAKALPRRLVSEAKMI